MGFVVRKGIRIGMLAVAALSCIFSCEIPRLCSGQVPQTGPSSSPGASVDVSRVQLDAATLDARQSLHQTILSYPLTPELNVGQLLAHTVGGPADPSHAQAEVSHVLGDAQQRGGTRWTTDQTCEVRLEISGEDIVAAIQPIIQDKIRRLPVSKEALERGLKDLKARTFSALGKSIGSHNLFHLRPRSTSDAWRHVNEADRQEAIIAARNSAISHVVQSVRPVAIGPGRTLDDALTMPDVNGEVRNWLDGRPITDVSFGDNLEVRLKVSAPAEELWPIVQSAMLRHNAGPAESNEADWASIRSAFMKSAGPAEGSGIVTSARRAPGTQPTAALDPPDWITGQFDADGSAMGGGLKATRAAEEAALQQLRTQIDALPWGKARSLSEAEKEDPRIARAVAAALRRAQTTRVDYLEHGVVKVRTVIYLDDVWRAIAGEMR